MASARESPPHLAGLAAARLARPRYVIEHAGVPAAEAEQVAGYIDQAIDALAKELDMPPPAALSPETCVVHIHPTPNDSATTGLATMHSGTRNGRPFADLHILAPSAHDRSKTTSVGEPFDDNFFRKLLVHELSTLFLVQATRQKPKGWRFHSAPAWFVQGYEEYLAVMLGSPHSKTVTLGLYESRLRADPDRVTALSVEDPYGDGVILLQYLHTKLGAAKMRALLASQAPSFRLAVASELGVSLDDLYTGFRAWARKA